MKTNTYTPLAAGCILVLAIMAPIGSATDIPYQCAFYDTERGYICFELHTQSLQSVPASTQGQVPLGLDLYVISLQVLTSPTVTIATLANDPSLACPVNGGVVQCTVVSATPLFVPVDPQASNLCLLMGDATLHATSDVPIGASGVPVVNAGLCT